MDKCVPFDVNSVGSVVTDFLQQNAEQIELLQDSHWLVQQSVHGEIGFFERFKNGNPRSSPVILLHFNEYDTKKQWKVLVDRYSQSFTTLEYAWDAFCITANTLKEEDIKTAAQELKNYSRRLSASFTKEEQQKQKEQKIRIDRGVDELIGICRGLLFTGYVTYSQIEQLHNWFQANPYINRHFVGRTLHQLVSQVVARGELTEDGELSLLTCLQDICGVHPASVNGSTKLPLTHPPPTVVIKGSLFVLTGTFKLGNRAFMTEFIESLGGKVSDKTVLLDTDYLLIGDIGSNAWKHSTHGRKIEKAVELRESGHNIAIIDEAHFMKAGVVLIEIARRRLLR